VRGTWLPSNQPWVELDPWAVTRLAAYPDHIHTGQCGRDERAAEEDHLEVLQWARANGCLEGKCLEAVVAYMQCWSSQGDHSSVVLCATHPRPCVTCNSHKKIWTLWLKWQADWDEGFGMIGSITSLGYNSPAWGFWVWNWAYECKCPCDITHCDSSYIHRLNSYVHEGKVFIMLDQTPGGRRQFAMEFCGWTTYSIVTARFALSA
jgi:hypothetical protein